MTDTSSLSLLFDRLHQGDRAVRNEILAAMQSRLTRLTRAILRDFPKVQKNREYDSVLQELNVKLLRAVDAGVKPEDSKEFMKFAGFRLRNLLKTEAEKYRRRGDNVALLDGVESDLHGVVDPGNDTLNPAHLLEWTEFQQKVAELDEDVRVVFDKHFFLQMPQSEIARELNMHPRQVSRNYIKATLALQKYLPMFCGRSE